MSKTYTIDGHTVEYRESSTGSCDPWSMDYANEHNINLMITADMAEFVLIDGDSIFRLNCSVAFPSAIKECLEKYKPTWEQFGVWFRNWIDRDFGSLKKSIEGLKEMELTRDIKNHKPMSGEEYTKTLQQLRKKRDYHRRQEERYDALMNELESDRLSANVHIGKYVKYKTINGDPAHYSDYTEYLYVTSVESTSRGFYLIGNGFLKTSLTVQRIARIRCYWDDIDNGNIMDISEDEYKQALRDELSIFEKEIVNNTPYDEVKV